MRHGYIEQVVKARNNLNDHAQLIKSYAQGLSVHDFTVLDFKGFLDLLYKILEVAEIKPSLQDMCVMKMDALLLKTSFGSAQHDGHPPAASAHSSFCHGCSEKRHNIPTGNTRACSLQVSADEEECLNPYIDGEPKASLLCFR